MSSQLGQDIFALQVARNKSYIEIGAWKPIKYSNTYLLEKDRWAGFSIELNEIRKSEWEQCTDRTNKIYWSNALTFDYISACIDSNLSRRIGYLSCDIEPPENTFSALKRVIEQGIVFDCITFEHDRYQSEVNYDPIVTEYLKNAGYKVAVSDVFRYRKKVIPGQKKKEIKICYMETWFVNNDIEFKSQSYKDWIMDKTMKEPN